MSPQQIIAIAVRLFAIWLAIYAVSSPLSGFVMDAAHTSHANDGVAFAYFAVFGISSLVLWFFPFSVARGLLKSADVRSAPSGSPDTWLSIGCALLGLWMLSYVLPALVSASLATFLYHSTYQDVTGMGAYRLIFLFAELAFAIWLILGAVGFRKLFWWARAAGTSKAL
jgi:hypothetical protein